jgi:hypothetical protein
MKNMTALVPYVKKRNFVQYLKKIFCIWVLFVRSFFITEKSKNIFIMFIPLLAIIIILLSKYFPQIDPDFLYSYILLWSGINLIGYDKIGSIISDNTLNSIDPIISITYLLGLKHSNHHFKRFVGSSSLSSIIFGKTVMTTTGRATLIAAGFAGTTMLYNEHLNRKAANARADKDREAKNARADKKREAANAKAAADRQAADARAAADRKTAERIAYQQRQVEIHMKELETWTSQPWYKSRGPKPVYKENPP